MEKLLLALMVLLNVGGVITIIWSIGQGSARWVTDLVTVVLFDVVGFYLLRVLREDG
ncbi:hypothetical protein [Deinococcus pimensis]|uniref:hypothetical protein n=1 Tax=Deinococcus pimensis TaxID=309888 RepID=UPI0004BBAFAD|nr:hypothetical protein [Deinococcus pimensis]